MVKGGEQKGLKTGTSLVESGHINEVRIHNISPDIKYCSIMAECTPKKKLLDEPYTLDLCS